MMSDLDRMDLFFAGHVHAYERSLPINGVQHFVVGHGGNMVRDQNARAIGSHA